MDVLLPFVIFLTLGLALLGALAARAYNRAAHGAITRYFQDAEYILQHQRPPLRWRSRFSLRRRDVDRQRVADQQRLAALISYFEHTGFVEDEETRAELLRQLRAAGESWQGEATPAAACQLAETD